MGRHPRVVCLLPARNAADDLGRGWFDSVTVFADAVVALDDGSTDDTASVLDAHPLVEILLRNPRRETHVGWDDSLNRNRLLEAAAALDPDWIISIDSDHIVPVEDGEALRQFVDERAVPGFAYGFVSHRMIDDRDHFDGIEHRGYRMFAYRPGQVFPADRLHFEPVPTSIPRCRWLATNLRIQHLGEITTERRAARRQKYREADPDEVWLDYSYMGAPQHEKTAWTPRRLDEPVLLTSAFTDWASAVDDATFDPEWPVLSVVLIVEEESIDEMIDLYDAVVDHACRYPVEVLVVARRQRVGDDIARLRPSAIVLVAANWASAASCRNLGLRAARGDYVVTFAAPAQLEPGAFDSLVEAHDRGCALVSGNIENLTDSAASWATFFADPGYASFAREPLLRAGGFDEWSVDGIEARARDRLLAAGHETASTSLLTFGHRSEFRNPDEYLRTCVERGRAIARDSQRAGAARGVVGRVARREAERVAASWKDADRRTSELADRFRRVRSVVVGSAAAVCAGTALERMLERVPQRPRVPQRALAAQRVSVPQPAPAPEPVALTAVPHVPFRTRRTGLRIAIANFGTPATSASGGLDYGASWEDVELPRQGPHVGLFDQDVKWGFHLYAPGIHLRALGLADIVEFWNFGPKRTMSFLSNGVLKVTFHDEHDVAAYLARFGPPDLFVNHGVRGVPLLRTLEGRTFRVHVPTYRTTVSKPLADAECFLLDAEWQLVDRSMLYIPVVDTERFRPGDGNTERDFVYLASCYSGKRHDLIVDAVRGTEITGHLHPVAPTALDLSGTKITTSDLDERDPVEIVQRSRIAVYPADETSNPAAMWECVAAGVPIVMNEAIAGGKHLVVPGVTGEFAREENFLDVMRDVLARRHDYAPREHFEANWDTVTLIEGYLRFFQEMGWNA